MDLWDQIAGYKASGEPFATPQAPATPGDIDAVSKRGTNGTAYSDHTHRGVGSLSIGSDVLYGGVTLAEGLGIDLTVDGRTVTVEIEDPLVLGAVSVDQLFVDSIHPNSVSPGPGITLWATLIIQEELRVDAIVAASDSPSGTVEFLSDVVMGDFAFTTGVGTNLFINNVYSNTESPGVGVNWYGELIMYDGTLVLGDTVYNDIYFPVSNARVPAANFPAWTILINNIYEYAFAVNDYIAFNAQEVPHGYKEGTDIDVHVHWATNGQEASDTAVRWEVEYTIANIENMGTIGEPFSGSTVLAEEQVIPAGTATKTHMYVDLGTIDGTNIYIGSVIKIRLRRIANTGPQGEPAANPYALMVGLHYQTDTVGSRNELTK